uniref:NOT2_3_5 domain-containing protein n=1 Tax=Macrostomum lignano TaxID=282301 RepID=A0A1I8F2Z6_9PLAT
YAVKIPSSANSFSIASLKPNSQLLAKEDRLSGQLAGNKHHANSNKEGEGEKRRRRRHSRRSSREPQQPHSAMPSFVAAVSRNPGAASAEFSIQQEDFPALPAAPSGLSGDREELVDELAALFYRLRRGSRVIRDRFGMLGLLSFIRLCEENREDTRFIGRGVDPNGVGLPMTQQGDLHPLLASPLSDCCLHKPQYSDHPVPLEYLVGLQVRDRLPPPPLDQLPVETLFWMFYACTCDRLQLCAAKELHKRHWRWVKADRLWAREFAIHYDQIDDSPANFPDPAVPSGSGGGNGLVTAARPHPPTASTEETA